MRSGKLRDFVTIEYAIELKHPGGDLEKRWQPLFKNLRCKVVDLGGGESQESDRTLHTGKYRIEMRYREDITEQCRAVVNGKHYEIKHALNVHGKGRELHLTCEAYS